MTAYLITGGAGFIGSHLAEHLVAQGARVRVLDNLCAGTLSNLGACLDQIEFIEGDIRDRHAVRDAVAGMDYILHHAALHSVPRSMSEPQEYHEVNVAGTLNLLQAAQGAKVKKFILASSSAAYGPTTIFPQREGCEAPVISPYALTKLQGEQYVRLFASEFGLPGLSVRYYNVFGPRQALEDEYAVVVPKFIQCFLRGESPPIYGDGTQSRDFTYVANVVGANLAACTADVGSGEVINVARGESRTVQVLAETIAAILQVPCTPTYLPRRKGDLLRSYADITRLKTLLGYTPPVAFDDGLRQTIAWFQQALA